MSWWMLESVYLIWGIVADDHALLIANAKSKTSWVRRRETSSRVSLQAYGPQWSHAGHTQRLLLSVAVERVPRGTKREMREATFVIAASD